MDIATIIGIAAGVILILSAIASGGNFVMFIHVPSMLIVFGGTIAATLINFPLADVIGVIKTVKNAFLHKAVPPTEIIKTVVVFATTARRDGII